MQSGIFDPSGNDQPPVPPETLGFSAERLQRLDRSLQQVADKEFAGMVTILTRDGKVVVAMMFLYEEGKWRPEDPSHATYPNSRN